VSDDFNSYLYVVGPGLAETISDEAFVHGSGLRADPPAPRAKITRLGSCRASLIGSSC
jgi:hypothetical protein